MARVHTIKRSPMAEMRREINIIFQAAVTMLPSEREKEILRIKKVILSELEELRVADKVAATLTQQITEIRDNVAIIKRHLSTSK